MPAFKIRNWNMEEFRKIRKSEGLVAELKARGDEWVGRLNEELHEAQARRNQPIEDGYASAVTTQGTRARLYVTATTARAMAHEAANQSMLKLMPVGDVKNPVDPNLPRELAERSNASRNMDAQGNPIHRLDQ